MARQGKPREEAVESILDLFRSHGYEGASLSLIAAATGLGRSSLYHHFPGGKEEMGRELFRYLGRQLQADVLAPLLETGTPRRRLAHSLAGLDRLYASGAKNCLLAAMVLGGGADLFASEIAGAFRAWIEALARAAEDTGVPGAEARRRAEDAVCRVEGALIVGRGLGERGYFQRVLREIPDQLLRKK